MLKHLILSAVITLPLASAALAQPGVPGAHFVENWDLDSDGQVTLQEATAKRGEIFYMFDQDENGALDSAEYDLFDETRQEDMNTNAGGYGNGPMRGVNQGLLREFNDSDGDGSVTEAEFLAGVAEWFQAMDQSGDGVITSDDFARRN